MKSTIRNNIDSPYTLHDMNVIEFKIINNDIVMKTQSGLVKTDGVSSQVDGYVVFHDVQWDFSFAYLLGVTGNTGRFSGEKMFLKDFISSITTFGFSVMDETYGYNMTKYNGFLLYNRKHCECVIEIYHEGDMVFVAED